MKPSRPRVLAVNGGSSSIKFALFEVGDRSQRIVSDAVALFCCQVKEGIGAFAAALAGLDTLVFSGGVGEHDPTVRARICEGLDFLGVGLHGPRNLANDPVVSGTKNRVAARVIPTDEEGIIARSVVRVLQLGRRSNPRGTSRL